MSGHPRAPLGVAGWYEFGTQKSCENFERDAARVYWTITHEVPKCIIRLCDSEYPTTTVHTLIFTSLEYNLREVCIQCGALLGRMWPKATLRGKILPCINIGLHEMFSVICKLFCRYPNGRDLKIQYLQLPIAFCSFPLKLAASSQADIPLLSAKKQ